MVTGHPQAVMVHTLPGTANALGGVINASRARVPILLLAGRTAITERGLPTSRSQGIHWAQESFDQGGLVREFVKWDYELRRGDLPVLFVVYNNAGWERTRRATLDYAPEGWAARNPSMPLCELAPPPAYDAICEANGGYGERVDDPARLPAALARALDVVRRERRQALLDVIAR